MARRALPRPRRTRALAAAILRWTCSDCGKPNGDDASNCGKCNRPW